MQYAAFSFAQNLILGTIILLCFYVYMNRADSLHTKLHIDVFSH